MIFAGMTFEDLCQEERELNEDEAEDRQNLIDDGFSLFDWLQEIFPIELIEDQAIELGLTINEFVLWSVNQNEGYQSLGRRTAPIGFSA